MPTIDEIEEAFSVEKVTKDFFEAYKEKYLEMKEVPTKKADYTNSEGQKTSIQYKENETWNEWLQSDNGRNYQYDESSKGIVNKNDTNKNSYDYIKVEDPNNIITGEEEIKKYEPELKPYALFDENKKLTLVYSKEGKYAADNDNPND